LDSNTLKSLGTVSKDSSSKALALNKESLFWKERSEYLSGINLPFDSTDVKYWKRLANELSLLVGEPGQMNRLYRIGDHEFVYIVIMLGNDTKEDTREVSVKFILNNSKWRDQLKLPLIKAVTNHRNKALVELLKHTTRKQVIEDIVSEKHTVLGVSIISGNLEAFNLILYTYPIDSDEYWYKVFDHIVNICMSNREEFLKALLDFNYNLDSGVNLADYVDRTKIYRVTADEMRMLLSSDLFWISVVYVPTNLTPEAAYLLYTLDDKSEYASGKVLPKEYLLDKDDRPSEFKIRLLDVIISDADMLLMALGYAKPSDGLLLLFKAFVRERIEVVESMKYSGIVVIKSYNLADDQIIKAIRACIPLGFYVTSVKYACIRVGMTVQDIEVIIMEGTRTFGNNSVKDIVDLGISLHRNPNIRYLIGEKVAFNCAPSEWKNLHDAGFSFSSCATDLMKVTVAKNIDAVTALIKYVSGLYSKDVYYIGLTKDSRVFDYLTLNRIGMNEREGALSRRTINEFDISVRTHIKKASELLSSINWQNMTDFTWLHLVEEPLASRVANIDYLKTLFFNKVLRGFHTVKPPFTIHPEENFVYWLMLARGLRDKVEVHLLDNSTVININYNITLKGKYKGLDLFSNKGNILTTREEIKARRAEIQSL
jgi:hypothetical protein